MGKDIKNLMDDIIKDTDKLDLIIEVPLKEMEELLLVYYRNDKLP